MGVLKVLNQAGDEPLEWDPADEESTSRARKRFDELKAKGYKAYEAVASKGREVKEFKADLGSVIMAPASRPAMGGGPSGPAPRVA